MNPQQERVLQQVDEDGVRLIRLWFTDVSGRLKGLAIDSGQLEEAFEHGVTFDGSAVEGLSRVSESDMVLIPDALTYQNLPWRGDGTPVARMFCDIHTPAGDPSLSDPRRILKEVVRRAGDLGLSIRVQPEIEFYLLTRPATLDHLVPVDRGSYFDHIAWGDFNDFRRKIVFALEEMGIQVEFSHHEGGPGQNEIDLRVADPLETADNIMTARSVISEVALQEGMFATFMPKPFLEHPGSGLHLHLSVFEGAENVLFSAGGKYHLSNLARHFMAGLLSNARGNSAVVSQHVNSYKRLWGGGEAPSYVCWGHNNRSALVRVPYWNPRRPELAAVEYRAADSATNPYLCIALLIDDGVTGIEQRLPLEPEAEDDVWALSDQELVAMNISKLPVSLSEALAEIRSSESAASVLGQSLLEHVLRCGDTEWQEYRQQITMKEYERFLDWQ